MATWHPWCKSSMLDRETCLGLQLQMLLGSAGIRPGRAAGRQPDWLATISPWHVPMYPGPIQSRCPPVPVWFAGPRRQWSRPSPNPSLLLCDAQAYFVHSTTSLSHVSGPGNKEHASRRRRYKVRPWHRNQELRIWVWIWLWLVSKISSSLTTPQTQPPTPGHPRDRQTSLACVGPLGLVSPVHRQPHAYVVSD